MIKTAAWGFELSEMIDKIDAASLRQAVSHAEQARELAKSAGNDLIVYMLDAVISELKSALSGDGKTALRR